MLRSESGLHLTEVLELQQRITRALYAADREALIRHKLEGRPIVVWRNGTSVKIAAADITVPPAKA